MDNDAADADRNGGMHDAHCGVPNHCPAETVALISAIDSKPGEHNNGDWVGHVAPETSRSWGDIHGAGSQGKIANDLVRLAHHERSRTLGLLRYGGANSLIVYILRFGRRYCRKAYQERDHG